MGEIGDYEILGEIARGGMGVVYRARQRSLDRVVALKVVLGAGLASEEARRRFRAEAQNAAALRHRNIVPVHEVGEHEGQPFFSMDLVEGTSLAELLRERAPAPRETARLLKTIANAIGFAHERGVLHRDLKPSNVLLDAQGEPHVTDFGLAKRAESAESLTASGQVLGTPGYLPPEQARGGQAGPWSDVYSLGAILYECVTGRPPFRGETPLDTVLQTLDREPVAPRLLDPKVPKDLETICLKCLRKEPQQRYASAQALEEDLGRFLDGRPILAKPAGPLRRLVKWARRRPAAAALLAVSAISSVAIVVTSLAFSAKMEDRLWISLCTQARAERLAGNREQALRTIRTASGMRRSPELRSEAILALALPELRPVRVLPWMTSAYTTGEAQAAFTADGSLLLVPESAVPDGSGGHRSRLAAWRIPSGEMAGSAPFRVGSAAHMATGRRGLVAAEDWDAQAVRLWRAPGGAIDSIPGAFAPLRFGPEGRLIATYSAEGTIVWDTEAGREVRRLPGASPVAFLSEEELVVNEAEARTTVWNHRTGERRSFRTGLYFESEAGGAILYSDATRSDGGERVTVEVRDARTGEARLRLDAPRAAWSGACLSPDGRLLALRDMGDPRSIRIVDVMGALADRRLQGLADRDGTALANAVFDPMGRFLAAETGTDTRVWHLEEERALLRFRDTHSPVWSGDGRWFCAVAGSTVRVYECTTLVPSARLSRPVHSISFRGDGRRLAANGREFDVAVGENGVTIRDALPGSPADAVFFVTGGSYRVDWPDRLPLHGMPEGSAPLLLSRGDQEPGAPREEIVLDEPAYPGVTGSSVSLVTGPREGCVAFSADGRTLALARACAAVQESSRSGWSDYVETWDVERVALLQVLDAVTEWGVVKGIDGKGAVNSLAFSPDGARVAWGDQSGLRLFDARSGAKVASVDRVTVWRSKEELLKGYGRKRTLPEGGFEYELAHPVGAVRFAAKGDRLYSGGADGLVKVHDAATGRELESWGGAGAAVTALAASPDDEFVAVGGRDGSLRLLDAATGLERARWLPGEGALTALDFSPDGRLLVSGGEDGSVRLWDLVEIGRLLEALELGW